jgi:hypothetical protein
MFNTNKWILLGFFILVAYIIFLSDKMRKLEKRVLVEGMAGALSDEAIQNIASVYNNGSLTVQNLRVTGDAIFDNGATMMENANNTCLRLQTKADNPNFADGFARIEYLNKNGSRVAWSNSHAHGIDHSNKAYTYWSDTLNAPGLTATANVTTIGGALNANKDVNIGGNITMTNKDAVLDAKFNTLNIQNIRLKNQYRTEYQNNDWMIQDEGGPFIIRSSYSNKTKWDKPWNKGILAQDPKSVDLGDRRLAYCGTKSVEFAC